MSFERLDDVYLEYLYSQVTTPRQRRGARTYWRLFRQLYTKEFLWFIPNDDNRIEDGKDIRREFANESGLVDHSDYEWMGMGCSVLEMLIGLSRRLSFEAGGEPREWFWKLLDNLGLANHNDYIPYEIEEVEETLDALIFRLYDANGTGGLFPLRYPEHDQTEVEIWYQLQSYLMENT